MKICALQDPCQSKPSVCIIHCNTWNLMMYVKIVYFIWLFYDPHSTGWFPTQYVDKIWPTPEP